jgi:hypothetical protein
VRVPSALALVAIALAGCGGDDDDAPAADAVVIESDDGRATLTLPPGVDGDGITVTAVDLDGAAAAYELLPGPTRFSEPATLTIADVGAPEPGALPFAISVADDGTAEALTVDATYDGDEPVATIALPIGHFGTAVVWYPSSSDAGQLVSVGVAAPESVVAGEPFDVTVGAARLSTRFVIPRSTGEIVVDVGPVLTSGVVEAQNADPSEVRDLPPRGARADFRAEATFTCREPGDVEVTWILQLSIESRATLPDGRSTERLSDADLRVRKHATCT